MKSKYSKEFREDALRLAEREGVAAAGEKLGIPKRYIYDWRRSRRLTAVRPPKGLKAGESLEEGYRRQEKEIAELSEANYILKKALGFFVGQ